MMSLGVFLLKGGGIMEDQANFVAAGNLSPEARERILESFGRLREREKGCARSAQWRVVSSLRPQIEELLRDGYTAAQIHRSIRDAGVELSYEYFCAFVRPWADAARAPGPGRPGGRKSRRASPARAATPSFGGRADYGERLDPDAF